MQAATLRKAIPAHCWERSAVKSFAYLAVDLVLMAALYYSSTFIDSAPVPGWAKWLLLWPSYWFWQVRQIVRGGSHLLPPLFFVPHVVFQSLASFNKCLAFGGGPASEEQEGHLPA